MLFFMCVKIIKESVNMQISMKSRLIPLVRFLFPFSKENEEGNFSTGDRFAIEAVGSSEAPLHLPSLHILIESIKGPKGGDLWRGHCLDLGIFAYSQAEKEEDVKQDIFSLITSMAISQILRALEKGTEEKLLCKPVGKMGQKMHSFWNEYNSKMSIRRISLLRESYDLLMGYQSASESTLMHSKRVMTEEQIEHILKIKRNIQIKEKKELREVLEKNIIPLYVMAA